MGCTLASYDFAGYYGYMTPEYINAASAPFYSNAVPAPEAVFPKEASAVYVKEVSAAPTAYLKEESKEATATAVQESTAQQTYNKEASAASAALIQEVQPAAVFTKESPQAILTEAAAVAEFKQEGPSAAYIKPSLDYYVSLSDVLTL